MVDNAFRKSIGRPEERDHAMDRAKIARPRTPVHTDSTHDALDAWARRRLGNTAHEQRVAQLADAWFDLTRDLHQLGRRAHWALLAGAIVHDIGRSIDSADHAAIGADLILSDPDLRLPPAARRWLAYLTLHHRGPIPELGRDEILQSADDRLSLWKVLGLLRAADTLDSRSIEPPRVVLMRRHRAIQVWCFMPEVYARAQKAFCRPKKYRLLERAIKCTIDVRVQQADARLVHV